MFAISFFLTIAYLNNEPTTHKMLSSFSDLILSPKKAVAIAFNNNLSMIEFLIYLNTIMRIRTVFYLVQ